MRRGRAIVQNPLTEKLSTDSIHSGSNAESNLITIACFKGLFSSYKKKFDTLIMAFFILYGFVVFCIRYKNILDTTGNVLEILKLPAEIAVSTLGSKALSDIISNNLHYYFRGEFCKNFRIIMQKRDLAYYIFENAIITFLRLSCILAVINVNYLTVLSFTNIFPMAALIYKGDGRYKPVYNYNIFDLDTYYHDANFVKKIAFLKNYFHGLSRINSEVDSEIEKNKLTHALNALMVSSVEEIDTTIEPFLNKILNKLAEHETNITQKYFNEQNYMIEYMTGGTNYYKFRGDAYRPCLDWIKEALIACLYGMKAITSSSIFFYLLQQNDINKPFCLATYIYAFLVGMFYFMTYFRSFIHETFYSYQKLRSSNAIKLNANLFLLQMVALFIAILSIIPKIIYNDYPLLANPIIPIAVIKAFDIVTSCILNFTFLRTFLCILFAKWIETPMLKAADAAAEFFSYLEIAMNNVFTDQNERVALISKLSRVTHRENIAATTTVDSITEELIVNIDSQPFRAANTSYYHSHNVISAYRKLQEAEFAHQNAIERTS